MKYFALLFLSLLFFNCSAQEKKPKLFVGIVIDQMRYDYLERYQDDFIESGFKKLMNEGYLYKNACYNYALTKTGPGHASIFTGTTPSSHGIIGNDWYVREIDRKTNCVEDTTEVAVGGVAESGRVSTRNLLTTTVTDELRLSSNFESKVVGVSIKDRGACLPSGHNPTGAYWYDLKSGNMITSTFYTDKLPVWVEDFNKKKRATYYLDQTWNLYQKESTYNESIADDNPFEAEAWKGFGNTFPYDYSKIKNEPNALKYSPFSNSFLREFAQVAIESEKLGMRGVTDMLTISFSATDDLGHRFGPRSKEIQDTYLRLDYEISELLSFLDIKVGKDNYTLFLTADHGAPDVSAYLVSNKMPGGYYSTKYLKNKINDALAKAYKPGDWVSELINDQVYLNHTEIAKNSLSLLEVQEFVADILLKESNISEAYPALWARKRSFTDPRGMLVQNSYNSRRSGDVTIIFQSGYISDSYNRKGVSHESPYAYDTHIPILFYGNGIKSGDSYRKVNITDIAPTVSALLRISLPSGSTGEPLLELFE